MEEDTSGASDDGIEEFKRFVASFPDEPSPAAADADSVEHELNDEAVNDLFAGMFPEQTARARAAQHAAEAADAERRAAFNARKAKAVAAAAEPSFEQKMADLFEYELPSPHEQMESDNSLRVRARHIAAARERRDTAQRNRNRYRGFSKRAFPSRRRDSCAICEAPIAEGEAAAWGYPTAWGEANEKVHWACVRPQK